MPDAKRRIVAVNSILFIALIELIHGGSPERLNKERSSCCIIDKTKLWSKELPAAYDGSFSAQLKPLLKYKFYIPHSQLKLGLDHYGAARRLRKFVSAMLEGKKTLKIGAVGGSITWGKSATSAKTSWFNIFSAYLKSVSKANVTSRNGCIPATPSAYMLMCLEENVDEDVDLVFIEYSLNDGVENSLVGNRIIRTMEQLVRRIMEMPASPAVVLVQVPHVWIKTYEPFWHTSEDLEGALSGYYDIPSISLRNALYPLAVLYPTDGFMWNQTYDGIHPGDSGHKIIADLAVHLIQETARDLLLDPVTPEELAEVARPLPETMYLGNLPPAVSKCVTASGFKDLIKTSEGWTWIHEAAGKDHNVRGKWGFVATEPGSVLQFEVNNQWPGLERTARIPLLIHYLKSYRGMGIARLECLSGCECEPLDIDAGLKAYHSQIVLVEIRVSVHVQCVMQLTVLNSTTTDGTKFMVTGLTIVGSPDYTADFFSVEFWNHLEQQA